MGGYLSWPRPRPLYPVLRGGDLPERPQRLGSAHPGRRAPLACRVHSGAPALDLSRRLSYQDPVASPHRRRRRRRFVVVHRPQYPIQQAWFLLLGAFSSVPRSGRQKPGLYTCISSMFRTSVLLKMASAKGKLKIRVALKQTVICMWSSLSLHLPNLCVKETPVMGLEESGPLRAKTEEELPALAEGRKGQAKRKEGHPVPESQDEQRRGSDGSAHAQSAFQRLVVNGVLASFVPRPGPLKRHFCSKSPGDVPVRKSQTHFLSSCSKRNAITSSYSSTRGFPPLQRGGPRAAGLLGPAASHLHAPAETAGKDHHQPSPSSSVDPQRKIEPEKAADAPSGKTQSLNRSQPSDGGSRPRKRKIPLLLPSRRNDPLILPPAPQPGYRVTAEDLDREKRAAIQWINKVLEGVSHSHVDSCRPQYVSSMIELRP
ncbi:nuclear envelope pore membrane protein POM 121-like isoform X2 [Camelus ferus]|uniref:Nuclear envelope pore membrane protein POM 121-like isoform X2 n=1 Tax=Camelus ferus TaxID=419612 RepID=A0A8B8RSV1_CAMFR|nr:nuclear envelope pore membrane protein POM 121-like isoform X2 [Camelus ferus]